MKNALLILLLTLGLLGCDRKGADGSPRRDKPTVGREDATQMLWRLPEVVAWSERVKGQPGGKVRPVCRVEQTPADCEAAGERPAWRLYFGVSAPTQTVLWNRFEVDVATGEIRVWDPADGSYMTLVEWRRGHRER